MPLRRRPPEPSPRLRALLASTPPTAGDTSVVPWQPDREWIEAVATSRAPVGPERPERRGRHRRPSPPGPRLFSLPESLVGARLSGPRAAVAGLLIVAVVAAAGFGVRVAWARAASTPQVVAPAQPGSAVVGRAAGAKGFASSSTASGGGGPPSAAPAAVRSTLTIHVVGQVKKPGVISLPTGARVTDAVAKAGGALRGADLAAVNLARQLVDGEQVRIPKPGEPALPPGGGVSGSGVGGSAGGGSANGAGGGGVGGAGNKLDLNRATESELEDLPGVGPVLAQRILDWRAEHGRFATVDELGEVSGIGEKIFSQLQPRVTV